MHIEKRTVRVGAKKPLRVLHISDSHLTDCDARDNARKQELAERRTRDFNGDDPERARRLLNEYLEYGRTHCDLIVHTGDVIDFTSEACFEELGALASRPDVLFAAGNHEFSKYVGEAWEDLDYKLDSFSRVQERVPHNIVFASRVVNGINFIALDDVYYNFTYEQYRLLEVEIARGLPIVLCMHTPIYHEGMFEQLQHGDPARVTYLAGCPDEKIRLYSDHRFRQQKADEPTRRFLELVHRSSEIRCILAGHIHETCEGTFENGLVQLAADGTYHDFAFEIEFI